MLGDRLESESPEYRRLRAELLEAEIALKDQVERVAELRRSLPRDTPSPDYALQCVNIHDDAPPRDVHLSDLISSEDRPLVLVHFMYGKIQKSPCPMCTMWADGYDATLPHLRQRVDFGVVVAGDLVEFREFARSRGWKNLLLISAADSTIKRDLRVEDADGAQSPGVSVFTRGADGGVRHFYTGSAILGNGHFRGMDLLSPVWNFFDLTPAGRGDWLPSTSYGEARSAASARGKRRPGLSRGPFSREEASR